MVDVDEKIKNLICELRDSMGKGEIIAIIYNPFREEGIQKKDEKFLMSLFDKVKYTYPLILLSGHGGDFSTAVYFPKIINKKVEKYRVFIPRICGSALCYTILKARELIIGENTHISQIDPLFEFNGEWVRAIEYLHSTDEDLRTKSRAAFDTVQEYVKQLIEPPCIFKYRDYTCGEFLHTELMVSNFMNKNIEHADEITFKQLEQLEANLVKIEMSDADQIANELVFLCQDYTIQQNARVVFVSSVPINLEESGQGSFIVPLD